MIETATTVPSVITKGNAVDNLDSQLASCTDIDDNSDDDNDPDHLVSRYIDAKLQLLKLGPEFQYETSIIGDSEHEKRLKSSQVSRLCQRVETIERDILFDRETANTQLNEKVNQLRAEMSRLRAEQLAPKPVAERTLGTASSQGTQQELDPAPNAAEAEDTADGLFGGLFSSVESSVPSHQCKTENKDDGLMLLVDFGKWAGVSPRRILEDVCKTR
jgi:ATP-dependent RNA helicase DHX29